MEAIDKLPVSIDLVLLGLICLTWAGVASGYHIAGVMPAGKRVWTAGAVLILALTALTTWFERREARG